VDLLQDCGLKFLQLIDSSLPVVSELVFGSSVGLRPSNSDNWLLFVRRCAGDSDVEEGSCGRS